jgi:hypothetical protein
MSKRLEWSAVDATSVTSGTKGKQKQVGKVLHGHSVRHVKDPILFLLLLLYEPIFCLLSRRPFSTVIFKKKKIPLLRVYHTAIPTAGFMMQRWDLGFV